jgi:hypothetical protein
MKKIRTIQSNVEQVTEEQKTLFNMIMNNAKPMGKRGGGKYSASVPVSLLWVDPAYQRIHTRSSQKIRDLANRWNEDKLTPVICVPHAEEYRFALVDGQGRLQASQMLAKPYTELDAIVLTRIPENIADRQKFEAEIFIGQDQEVEPVKPIQKHNALLLLGDKAAMIVQNICDKYDISFTERKGNRDGGVLGSYPTTYKIAKIHGEKCINFIFSIIEKAGWKNEANGYSTYVMRALKDTWVAHPGERKEIYDYLSQELRLIDPMLFKSRAITRYPYRDPRACTLYIEDILCTNLRLNRKIYDDGKKKLRMIN